MAPREKEFAGSREVRELVALPKARAAWTDMSAQVSNTLIKITHTMPVCLKWVQV